MDQCDGDSPSTYGHTTGDGCLDYSINVSGITGDGSTRWKVDPKFPPPEFEMDQGNVDTTPPCSQGQVSRPAADDDVNKAIDGFCQDGAEIKGYGQYWENMYDFPPKEQPQFYNADPLTMHLTMGAETVNNGGPTPYANMDWCKLVTFLSLLPSSNQ